MDIRISSLMTILDMVMCIWWKPESFERFKEFRNEIEIQIEKSIKIFRLDWGGEYLSLAFQDYLKDNEILS
jgi:hypothetical protein